MRESRDAKISQVMTNLYGPVGAERVNKRLQFLDPELNRLVQDFAYEQVWGGIGGDTAAALKTKSIATISALIALGREEQIRIHLMGFFNLKGSLSEIKKLIQAMKVICEGISVSQAESALVDTVKILESEGQALREQTGDIVLPRHLQHVILLAARVALGNREKTEQAMREIAKERSLTIEEIGNIIKHMAVYCGFPAAMDGFVALKACETAF